GKDRRAVFVSPKTGISSFAELLAYPHPIVAAATTAASSSYLETVLVNALTGSKLKAVAGYTSSERKLAILSGEASAVVGSIDTFSELVDQGALKPVLRLNDAGPGAPFPETPLLRSFAKGDDADLLVGLISGIAETNNLAIASPGLSADQLSGLTGFFDTVAARLKSTPPKHFGGAEAIPNTRA